MITSGHILPIPLAAPTYELELEFISNISYMH